MFDTQKLLHDDGIVEVIRILAANHESGRLGIKAGTTEGAIFFKTGQLVDARVGHLTGFQAINAVASMRDARFSFDPSVAPPAVSSITPNERVVLKQFFGIETAELKDAHESPAYPEPLIAEVVEDVTLETEKVPSDALRNSMPYPLSRRFLYRGGLALAVLFILIAAGAVALRNEFREREMDTSVATTVPSPAAPVAAQVKQDDQVSSAAPKLAAAPEVAQNLSGKWNIVNTVQQTSYKSFQNLKIGFDLSIDQTGKRFTGKGEKVSENGQRLPADSRTPIEVEGSIDGDRIEATFFEKGTLRKTNGRFAWKIDKAGALTGTFNSTAARSSGKSAARRS